MIMVFGPLDIFYITQAISGCLVFFFPNSHLNFHQHFVERVGKVLLCVVIARGAVPPGAIGCWGHEDGEKVLCVAWSGAGEVSSSRRRRCSRRGLLHRRRGILVRLRSRRRHGLRMIRCGRCSAANGRRCACGGSRYAVAGGSGQFSALCVETFALYSGDKVHQLLTTAEGTCRRLLAT